MSEKLTPKMRLAVLNNSQNQQRHARRLRLEANRNMLYSWSVDREYNDRIDHETVVIPQNWVEDDEKRPKNQTYVGYARKGKRSKPGGSRRDAMQVSQSRKNQGTIATSKHDRRVLAWLCLSSFLIAAGRQSCRNEETKVKLLERPAAGMSKEERHITLAHEIKRTGDNRSIDEIVAHLSRPVSIDVALDHARVMAISNTASIAGNEVLRQWKEERSRK